MIVMLVGFMGAGKTTVGHIVAERLGLPFIDSDVLIEQRLGRSIREVFETEGEPFFRELEHETAKDLARSHDAVVALGGGALGDPRTRAAMRHARVVYLRVGYDSAMKRVRRDKFRPLLNRPDLADIYEARLPIYEALAAISIDTDGRRPAAIALDVLGAVTRLPKVPAGGTSIFVTSVGGSYYAYIGPGLIRHVRELLPPLPEVERVALIEAREDAAVAADVADQLRSMQMDVVRIAVDDSQASKSMSTYARVADAFAEHAIHKGDLVLAVGGESTCELAGFVAATFNRGMKLALVPTTLAAQADAAVGGKNGINLKQGHNLLGAIHQPLAVISDVQLASRNRSRGYESGLAEIAKHALIASSDLLPLLAENAGELVAGDDEALRAAVARSIEVKADIVSRDEREQGDRVFLNYGHTFAHAMEWVRSHERADWDDSLALGLMAAAYLAHRQGRLDMSGVEAHRGLLQELGLPTTGRFDFEAMCEAWRRDKKYKGGMRFVVLNGLGNPEGGVHADFETLELVLRDLAQSPA